MSKPLTSLALLLVNVALLVGLFRARSNVNATPPIPEIGEPEWISSLQRTTNRLAPAPIAEKPTAFTSVYSTRTTDFAANLRRAGCPEETVRDILLAEIGRRYRGREEDLRPTPGDHLPFGWSAKTHEAKIIDRRQRAAAIAREKEAELRTALGYEVKVPIPTYAMTVSDQRFADTLDQLPPKNREAAHRAHEHYWTMVEQLRARTHGFWQDEDLEELNQLKNEREQALEKLKEAQ
jgi:hypothetical protein